MLAVGLGWSRPYITYPQRPVGSIYFGDKSCSYSGNVVVCDFLSLEDLQLFVVCVDEDKKIEGMPERMGFSQVGLEKGLATRVCGLHDHLVGIFKSALLAEAYISKYTNYYQQVTE